MKPFVIVAASLLAFVAAAPATAATFTESLDLPSYDPKGPRVLQSTGSFTTGTKLTAANQISNPSLWGSAFNVFLDTVAQTITLTGDGNNVYQTISFDLTGVTGLNFTGFTAVTPYGATSRRSADYGVTTSFTSDSLRISYAVTSITKGNVFEITTGKSVFSYTTGAVPEPGTWALMILGFGLVGYAMRRRSSVQIKHGVA